MKPIFKGRLVKEKDGTVVCHRVWFKILLNPILRKLGYVIVSQIDEQENVTSYFLSKYPILNLPDTVEEQEYQKQFDNYTFCKKYGIPMKKPKKPKNISDPSITDRGWDIPPMFTYPNTPTPLEGEGTPSAIQNTTPTLFL